MIFISYKGYIIVLFFLCVLTSCAHNSDKNYDDEIILVNHYKAECIGLVLSLCYLVKDENDKNWSFFYEPIDGFEFEWGFQYKLLIEKRKGENPPQDSSAYRYKLLRILDKNEVPSNMIFNVSVSSAVDSIKKLNDVLYRLHGDVEFICDAQDCIEIDSLIRKDRAILFEFKYAKDKKKPFELTRIKCSSVRELYRDNCNLRIFN